ncbi:hypothetical protein K0M31_007281 [Melipona bicolor]|uniref:Uncharacterized protein n=1 Tax=Melipona bicolor TaxID=60889 RepID=A0AA40GBC6_9HYME|nr:hypothetical protein K0M31_007281 [Melipona bicolor]
MARDSQGRNIKFTRLLALEIKPILSKIRNLPIRKMRLTKIERVDQTEKGSTEERRSKRTYHVAIVGYTCAGLFFARLGNLSGWLKLPASFPPFSFALGVRNT